MGGGEPYPKLIDMKCYIRTPTQNAYDEYERLLKEIRKNITNFNNPIVVLSCGITATALAAEVNEWGITAYDVGLCFTRKLAAVLNTI